MVWLVFASVLAGSRQVSACFGLALGWFLWVGYGWSGLFSSLLLADECCNVGVQNASLAEALLITWKPLLLCLGFVLRLFGTCLGVLCVFLEPALLFVSRLRNAFALSGNRLRTESVLTCSC